MGKEHRHKVVKIRTPVHLLLPLAQPASAAGLGKLLPTSDGGWKGGDSGILLPLHLGQKPLNAERPESIKGERERERESE